MCVCLTIMGIYFFKSTDLPKDLKERSAQARAKFGNVEVLQTSGKINFPKDLMLKNSSKELSRAEKDKSEITHNENHEDFLAKQIILEKKLQVLQKHNGDIKNLKLTILRLEHELTLSSEKVNKMKEIIGAHKINLQKLQEEMIS